MNLFEASEPGHSAFKRSTVMEKRITVASTQALLDPLCREDERDFQVVFSDRSPKLLQGKYVVRLKLIVLYPKSCPDEFELEAVALHELAHHLCRKRNEAELSALFHQGKRVPRHGPAFKKILEELVRDFNSRYEEWLPGKMIFEGNRATSSPRFRTPEEAILEIIFGKQGEESTNP